MCPCAAVMPCRCCVGVRICLALLNAGADPNVADDQGLTPAALAFNNEALMLSRCRCHRMSPCWDLSRHCGPCSLQLAASQFSDMARPRVVKDSTDMVQLVESFRLDIVHSVHQCCVEALSSGCDSAIKLTGAKGLKWFEHGRSMATHENDEKLWLTLSPYVSVLFCSMFCQPGHHGVLHVMLSGT